MILTALGIMISTDMYTNHYFFLKPFFYITSLTCDILLLFSFNNVFFLFTFHFVQAAAVEIATMVHLLSLKPFHTIALKWLNSQTG